MIQSRLPLVLILIAAALLPACQNATGPPEARLDEAFDIRYGGKVSIAGESLSIQFLDVPEDSRCPEGVVCVWAGNAKVALRVVGRDVDLNTYLEPRKDTVSDYTVELVSLNPYPVYNQEIEKEEYTARLLVRRN